MKIEFWPIEKPRDYEKNARKWSDAAIAKVAISIKTFGFVQPVVVDKKGVIIIGHLRRAAARTIPLETVPVHVAAKLTPAQVRQLRLMDNRSHEEATWDVDILSAEMLDLQGLDLDLSLTGFSVEQIEAMLHPALPDLEAANRTLAERFGVPPFSVLDARQGYWQDRKRAWLALGIQSELGRGGGGASPGGSPRPACDYSRNERGDGAGRSIQGSFAKRPHATKSGV